MSIISKGQDNDIKGEMYWFDGASDGQLMVEEQANVIEEGIQRVKVAFQNDKTVISIKNSNEDPADREAALAAMMGINHGSEKTNAAPVDLTAIRARRSLDKVEAVRGCETLECLRIANNQPPGRSTFNFPHFIIAGWQKSATTSLHYHLVRHPSVSRPWEKEPEFFSELCHYNAPEGCTPEDTKRYITRTLRVNRYAAYDGKLAHYEASTHYSRNGHVIAPLLYKEMPWIKIILLLREPISRASSMLIHLLDKEVEVKAGVGGCLRQKNMDLGYCLLHDSQISGSNNYPSNYSMPLQAWLETFPKEQLYIGQVCVQPSLLPINICP